MDHGDMGRMQNAWAGERFRDDIIGIMNELKLAGVMFDYRTPRARHPALHLKNQNQSLMRAKHQDSVLVNLLSQVLLKKLDR